ncbi:group II intron reverse transcriptase/maturase [Mucilaginibacter dorajii]|uniref:Group II intron reverse transcriptase/maturase n=2 Tax=Mucilaginibacter dorajii TaxID=692994 RepID=A0ABP7Q5U9_9SPHI
MIKTSTKMQELRRRIYIKAKAEKAHRFWGMYVHVTKMETLQEAYRLAKAKDGAPGIDGVTFEQIEETGAEVFLLDIQQSLMSGSYLPARNRIKEILKDNGKTRTLGIPTIRDRVVQAALKLVIEPIFEADFQDGSYGYRPKRTAHTAVRRVEKAAVKGLRRVIDLDLKAYFDTIRHDILLNKVAERVDDDKIMKLLKLMLKAGGKIGVPQGGVISPLLSNIYLNEVDKMLEKAKETTRNGVYNQIEYARFADDMVILVSSNSSCNWIWDGVNRRLREELNKVKVEINEEKTRYINLYKDESFNFMGFNIRMVKTQSGKMRPNLIPKEGARTKLLNALKEIFRRYRSQPLQRVVQLMNPTIRGWIQYFKYGHSHAAFRYIKSWISRKVIRHIRRSKGKGGFGRQKWSMSRLFKVYNIYNDYTLARWKVEPI